MPVFENGVNIVFADSPYNMPSDAGRVSVDTTSGVVVVNLPTASSCAERVFVIKDSANNTQTNKITIGRQGSENIDGNASDLDMNTSNGQALWIFCDGSNFFTFGGT